MIITKEFIEENSTEKGGYTKAQLQIINISWPPYKGWKEDVIGKEISKELAEEFKKAK